jgi:hypothetical protein
MLITLGLRVELIHLQQAKTTHPASHLKLIFTFVVADVRVLHKMTI